MWACFIFAALVVLAGCSTTPSATPSTAATPTTPTTTGPPSEADVSTVQTGCAELYEVSNVVTQAANGGGTSVLLTLPDSSGKAANAWLAVHLDPIRAVMMGQLPNPAQWDALVRRGSSWQSDLR